MPNVNNSKEALVLLQRMKSFLRDYNIQFYICDSSIVNIKIITTLLTNLKFTTFKNFKNAHDLVSWVFKEDDVEKSKVFIYNLNDENINGISFIQMIQEIHQFDKSRIVFLTPKMTPQITEYFLQFANVTLLQKPISLEGLVRALISIKVL